MVMAALRYSRARQRAERTATLLTELTSVALDINTAISGPREDDVAMVAVRRA